MIDTVTIPGIKGLIGISSCPGMKDESSFDLYGESLIDDLLTIRNWGAVALVTLLEEAEFNQLGVKDLFKRAEELSLVSFHLPVRNLSVPDESFDREWLLVGARLCEMLRNGERIVLHCREGIGRAGVVAARLLIELGLPPEKAIKAVQKARPGSLQLYLHEKYCYSLAARSKASTPELINKAAGLSLM